MSQPGARSRVTLAVIWLVLGLVMIGLAGWVGWTRGSVVLSGHPALLIVGIASFLLGLVAVAWSIATLAIGDRQDREGDPAHPARRTRTQLERRARWRIVAAIPALVVCLLLVVSLAYARPLGATPVAVAAMRSGDDVRVADRLTWFEMSRVRKDDAGNAIKPTTGFVFVPGAKVDPRAYAHLLRPLVEAGYFVAVMKEPFGIAFLDRNHAGTVVALHPEITYWAVGGHSLGGVAASSYADGHEQVKGLVLYASYPSSALTRTDLKVLSVSAQDDGLATPAKIEASKADLPADTQYLQVAGASHSYFGDYGPQKGDNPGTADRAVAQGEMITATQTFLASLTPPPPAKKKK
ncbi:MAG TPA: alpha/beta hydrolase [Propionibacteriaceae bacterium]